MISPKKWVAFRVSKEEIELVRAKVLFGISLVLNLALLLAVWMDARAAKSRAWQTYAARPESGPTNPIIRLTKTNIMLGSVIGFSWRDIESPDYRTYIYNLRSVGCPDSTVRDILVADINQLYLRRRLGLAPTNDLAWWHSDADTQRQALESNIVNALDQERRALLTSLLGTNWDMSGWLSAPAPVALVGPVLGILSPETQQKVQGIYSASTQRIETYLRQVAAAGQPANPAVLAQLEQNARAQLAQVLSPEQLEEFQLRYSPSAARLRAAFKGFELAPDEFRALVRAQQTADAQFVHELGEGEFSSSQSQQLVQQREAAIRSALSPERYAVWSLQQNPAFQEAADMAVKAGASPQVALTLFEISQAAAAERQRIQNDPNLSDEEKAAELDALEEQQNKVRDQILGKTPKPAETAAAPPPQPPPVVHQTGPYETVAHLSLQYGVPMSLILQANPQVDFNRLAPGTAVTIPPWVPSKMPNALVPFPSGGAR